MSAVDIRVPKDWESTLDRFRSLGFTNADIAEALRIARDSNARNPWRYACGILWNRADERSAIGSIMAAIATYEEVER